MLNTNGSPWPIAHSRSPSPASSTPAIATTHQRESRAPGAAPRRTGAVISAADARTARGSRSEVSSEGTDEGGHPRSESALGARRGSVSGASRPHGPRFFAYSRDRDAEKRRHVPMNLGVSLSARKGPS